MKQKISLIKNKLHCPIALVGLMGVGKSTIGRRLAAKLDCDFVDADDEIEHASQMKIPEIFDNYGEEYFRDGERRVLERIIHEDFRDKCKIVSTGGGAFINDQTRALLLEKTITIWLNADIPILAERVSRRNTRPLLRDKDPIIVLSELAEKRNPYYSEADIHILSNNGPHSKIVSKIIDALAKWLDK